MHRLEAVGGGWASDWQRRTTTRSSPSPRTSPYPPPSSFSPRRPAGTHTDKLEASFEERTTTGKVATAARKSRRTAAAAVTSASVSTGSNETSTQGTRPVRSLPKRANKASSADKSAIDEPARRPTQRKANVEKLASPPADTTSRTSASRKRSAVALPDDTPSTTSTHKSAKKARRSREIDFDDDEPAVLPAGPSQSAKLSGGSKLSEDARRKAKGKAKTVVDEREAELVRLKQELKEKEELAEKQSQALASIRSTVSCGLCNELFENPHSLKCGHIFCRSCLEIAWTTEPDSNEDAHNSERSDSATDSEDDACDDESDASGAVYPRRRPGFITFRPLGAWLDDDEDDEDDEDEDVDEDEEEEYDTAPYSSGAFYGLTIGKKRIIEVDNLQDEDAERAFERASAAMLDDFVAYTAKRHQQRRAPSPTPSASSSGARIEEIDDDEAAEIEQFKAGPSRVRSGRREPIPARDGLALALTRRVHGGASRRSPSPTPASSRSPSPAPSANETHKEICCPTCGKSCADTRPTRVVLFDGILDTIRRAGVTASGVVGGDKGKKKQKDSVAGEEDETWGGFFPVEEKKEDSPVQVVEVAENVEEKEVAVEAVTKDDRHNTENLPTDESGSKNVSGEVEKPGKSGEGNASTVANTVEPLTAVTTVKDHDEASTATVASSSATPLTAKPAPTGFSTPSFFGITAFRSSTASSTSLSSDSSFATSAAAFGLPARSRSRSTSSSSASSSSSQDSTSASSVLEEPKQDPSSARHIRGESERKNKDSGLRLETEVLKRSASPSLRIARPQQGRKSGLGSDSTGSASGSSKTGGAQVEISKATTTRKTSRKRAREEEDGETATAKEAVVKGKKARRA